MKVDNKYISIYMVVFLFVLGGCQNRQTAKPLEQKTVSIDSLFEAFHMFKLKMNPLEATNIGLTEYNGLLVNYISEDVQTRMVEEYSQFLTAIHSINQSILNESQQLRLKVMQWDCEIKKEGLTNTMTTVASPMFDLPNISLMPINQIFSFHLYIVSFAEIGGAQPFNTVTDYENWLLRVDDFLIWLKTAQTNMQEGILQKIVLPKVIIEKMIGQLDQFANPDIETHIYYSPIKNIPEEISAAEQERLDVAYRQMISDRLIPAYIELQEFLSNVYLPEGTESSGISSLPNGESTYQYLIKYHTTTNMTPDEVFDLGQKEVKRILQEMEKVKTQVGFEGNLKSFFDHVRTSKEQMPFSKPEQVLQNFESIHERMKGNLDKLFNLTPKGNFEVRRTQAFRETSASAEYLVGAKDGSRPGIFYVPIPNVSTYNKYSDEALFLHEAIPGHHYQLSLQQENEDLPSFLHAEGMGVFVEGWALYAESLGVELGLYKDPYQYFGMLGAEMHRAIRLVVDAGIHAKGWTREQAIQYSLNHEAESEASIISEIERYMVAPGQALAYKVGQLKIMELRSRAEMALGENFNIKEFHNQVLNSGSLPLVLLEDKIDNWITKHQAKN
ncbi:MAG: DUF885 domain-containing protein [Bacteroidetes bacterium]|nr:MAG: DUF885 domain-containing protein [Bacteroidota bacterium]